MRFLIVLLFGGLVGLALFIYEVKHETRALDARAAQLRTEIRAERDAIAVLRAEWSLLNRPDRVERLARKHLGLEDLPTQRLMTQDSLQLPARQPAGGEALQPMTGEDARRQPASLVH